MAFDLDLFVIGGGSGGVRAARVASGEHKARVALAEADRMGGTCVIRGCVPKKLMVFASSFRGEFGLAGQYGWDLAGAEFDWGRFHARLEGELDRLEQAYRDGLTKAGVAIHDTRALVEDAHTVRLATGERLTAKHILVATGGHPSVPEAARTAGALTSDDMFQLKQLPGSILIVGGGFIACEFACILNGFGVKVTQIYRGAQVLRGFDGEARGAVAEAMRAQGIDLHVGTDVMQIERKGGRTRVKKTTGGEATYDAVLYATGRDPNSRGFGLEEAGVRFGRRGEVAVDGWSQTSVPSIYAVGDVTGRIALTPVAIREGHAFADTVFGARPWQADHALVPSAVFTQPELGSVGMTEEAAREAGEIEVYATAFRPMRTAFAGDGARVMMKLVVDRATRKVLGCHIVAPGAAEMIQLAAVAIRMGATKEDFDRTVAVHPTMAEELVTMRHPVRSM
ncbi:MAG: glutathione-disulfide reductase [Paracoccaceae bacterium]